ncbi:MAG: hypothetical protein QOK21_158 [Solirubrobacteraceae bacterium]|jgi:hypothetical protein|nr:hypothetical protein [Solirubrobacteraceae bacterium]
MAAVRLPARPWEALPAPLGDVLTPGVEALGAEIVAAIRAGVPAYGRPLEGEFGRGLRDGVAAALRQFVGLIGGIEQPPLDRTLYRELGRNEFRAGRTLDGLLAAYRLGARVAWRRAAGRARAAGHDAETLALLAESVFAYIDELSAASAEGYAAEQAAGVHEVERARQALLAMLVRHPAADADAVAQAASAAGWALPERLAALAWEPDAPRAPLLPPDALRGRAGDVVVAFVPDPDAPGRRAQLAAAFEPERSVLGPVLGWRAAGLSARRARQVLALAGQGVIDARGLLDASDHLATLLVHAEPGLASELAATRLAPLAALPGGGPERMATTLRAWLDHHGNVPATARALAIHPQTVRYRLRRLRSLLGDSLDDPSARFELSLALRST